MAEVIAIYEYICESFTPTAASKYPGMKVHDPDSITKFLNQMANDDWELFQVFAAPSYNDVYASTLYYFRREISY